jgi:hypothetical protein
MIKTIFYRGTMKGHGLVNLDGNGESQKSLFKYAFMKGQETSNFTKNDNQVLAKHVYTKIKDKTITPAEGEPFDIPIIEGKVAISNNCLRNAIFSEGMPNHSKSNRDNDKDLARIFGHPAFLLRGWMETKEKGESKKKKDKDKEVVASNRAVKLNSALTKGRVTFISYAVQSNNAVPYLEVHSNMGKKEEKQEATDTSANNFFFKESIGDIDYTFSGAIHLANLMFLSMDDVFDQMAIHPDYVQEFIDSFKKHTGLQITPDQIGKYAFRNQANPVPSLGILFNKEQVLYLVRYFFSQVAQTSIERASGSAIVNKLEYKLVDSPTKTSQLFNQDDNYINIETLGDIDKIDFDPYSYYEKVGE